MLVIGAKKECEQISHQTKAIFGPSMFRNVQVIETRRLAVGSLGLSGVQVSIK